MARSKKSSPTELTTNLPPQNLEAEKAVLGSMLLSSEAIDEIADVVQPRHFYLDSHRRIAEVIFKLYETKFGGIDAVTVAEELERRGELEDAGGVLAIGEILESVPHSGHAKYYARIVRDKFVQRALRDACTAILKDVAEEQDETPALLTKAEQRIFQILEQQGDADKISIGDILLDAFDAIKKRMEQTGGVSGLPSGFERLDSLTSGFQPAELIIVAARPSMGKTAFVCNLAQTAGMYAAERETTEDGHVRRPGVVLFSLEQSKTELAERLLCIYGRIDGHKLKKGEIDAEDQERLLEASGRLSELPIFIDDHPGRSMSEIAAICRRIKRRFGLGLVIIDYLQLIEPEDKNAPREQQVALIARRLKFLAKEMAVPVIALAQLNRGVDLRQDKQPKLADLRESGAIEQDADLVLFLHRPEAYDPADRPGEAEIILAKHRNGPTGICTLYWHKQYLRFENMTDRDIPGGSF